MALALYAPFDVCMHPWAMRVDRPPLSPTLWREVREASLCTLYHLQFGATISWTVMAADSAKMGSNIDEVEPVDKQRDAELSGGLLQFTVRS